jgi:hypothetical protein
MGEKNIIKFGVSMPHPIVFQIDKVRGDIPRSRFILRILERALNTIPEQQEGKQTDGPENREATA